MYSSLIGALEMGLLYAFMALGVYITFRILDFPDLTVDGSFTTGGAIAAVMITHGYSPCWQQYVPCSEGWLQACVQVCCTLKGRSTACYPGFS